MPPVPLKGEALAFWRRHFRRLEAAKVLTEGDEDAFAVLCNTWGMLQALAEVEPGADNYREMVQVNNLLKQFQSLAAQFGLMPKARIQSGISNTPPDKPDEFGV